MSGSDAALALTLALYLVGAVILGANLFLRRPGLSVGGRAAAVLGALLHLTSIGLHCAEVKRAPFTTPAESVILMAWMVVLAYLITEVFWRLSAAGPFALGLSFLLILIGIGFSPDGVPGHTHPPLLSERAVSLHITAIISAFAAFALAFCCAALYLVEHRILKSKHGLSWIKRLPPLATVESAAFILVALGFPLLTLGILAGMTRAFKGGLEPGWLTDPKTLLAWSVWAVYGVYLFVRMGARWTPVRTAYVLLIGLPLCLLLFVIPSASHRFTTTPGVDSPQSQ